MNQISSYNNNIKYCHVWAIKTTRHKSSPAVVTSTNQDKNRNCGSGHHCEYEVPVELENPVPTQLSEYLRIVRYPIEVQVCLRGNIYLNRDNHE